MSKLLIFVPCFRCENQIERVIYKIKTSGLRADILLVDNISPDDTLQKAKSSLIQEDLRPGIILKNQENYSLGGSHKVAFNYALENNYSHVIVLHGDDQADINDLVPFINQRMHEQYDCFLGSRFHPQSRLVGYSKFRILGNKVLNLFCSLVCRSDISDMGSGLNMYNREFLEDRKYLGFPDDLTFNVFLLFHAYSRRAKTAFFPITWREEDQISNAKVFRQMFKIMGLIKSVLNAPDTLYAPAFKNYSSEVYYQQ